MSNVPTLFDSLGKLGQHKTIDLKQIRCPGLPEGYKLCAYVESNRDCYIDTGIPSSDKVGIQMTYMYLGPTPTSAGEAIIGAGKSTDGTRQWINDVSITSGSGLCVGWGGDSDLHGIPSQPGKIAYGQVNFMMSNTATVTIPEATATPTDLQLGYDAKFSSNTLYLFAANSGDGAKMYTHSRLYRCRISVGRQVKRDFVPVRRESDGKYGLFESVEKKVYFPEQGNLAGLELSSLWDYSYFAGAEGAYIDDYPTPDSPNFVKDSGVEAGMTQIREALMVGPMVPSHAPATSNKFTQFFAPFVKNCVVGGTRNASAFLNVPNFIQYTKPATYNESWIFVNDTSWKSLGIRLPIFKAGSYMTFLGNANCASCYLSVSENNHAYEEEDDNLYIGTSNNDVVCVTPQTLVSKARSGTAVNLQNATLRYISSGTVKKRPGARLASSIYDTTSNNSNCRIYVYYSDLFDGSSTDSGNTRIAYSPAVGKNSIYKFYAVHYMHLSAVNENISATTFTQPFNMESVVYRLKYLKRNYNTTTYIQGIDAQYFSIGEGQIRPTGTVTYSNFVLDKSTGTISVDATDGTNSCTYTLLPNDEASNPKFYKECRQLREVLWNTNGVNGTSTGLLDGVVQVGPNMGQQYSAYCTLELRPVVHTWSD